MARVRIRFTKLGKVRWTSHRDVARMWERAFRRVRLPLVYSQGFTPRPRLSFGLALPTGYESLAEYLDVELAEAALDDLEVLGADLSAALPAGVEVARVATLAPGAPSLQEEVSSCTWRWTVVDPVQGALDPGEVSEACGELLAASTVTLTRERKGRETTDDVRPAIIALRVLGAAVAGPDDGPGVRVEAELACRPRSLRPSELQQCLAVGGPRLEERDGRRLHQWISQGGARWEPLGATAMATPAPHAAGRAS